MRIIARIAELLFVMMGLSLFSGFFRVRHVGLLLGGLAYAGAGILSYYLSSWWPLPAGFVIALSLRRIGLDPGALRLPNLPIPPDQTLQRISSELGRQRGPDEFMQEVLTGSTSHEATLSALIDYCLAKPDLEVVRREFGVTRNTIEELYSQLCAAGAGRWANGHYVPASAVPYPDTLRFLLERHGGNLDPLNKSFLVKQYFETGTPLERARRSKHP